MWAAVVNTLGKTKTSKNPVRKKVSKVVVVVEAPLIKGVIEAPHFGVIVSFMNDVIETLPTRFDLCIQQSPGVRPG